MIRRAINRLAFGGRSSWLVLAAPAMIFLLAVFVVPLALLGWVSLWQHSPDGFGPTAPTAENYLRFFGDAFFLEVLARTVLLSLATTAVALLIAYPLALYMIRASARVRAIIILLLLMPLLTSAVVRIFGWVVILGNNGLVNRALMGLGLIDQPVQILQTWVAVVIGLVNVELVFAVLPIFTALLGLDSSLREAAATLGATGWKTFRHVILPLSLPGVIAGSALVFVLAMASFIQPQLLGGARFMVMTMLMYQHATATLNWPFAAAISVILTVIALLSLFGLNRCARWMAGRARS